MLKTSFVPSGSFIGRCPFVLQAGQAERVYMAFALHPVLLRGFAHCFQEDPM